MIILWARRSFLKGKSWLKRGQFIYLHWSAKNSRPTYLQFLITFRSNRICIDFGNSFKMHLKRVNICKIWSMHAQNSIDFRFHGHLTQDSIFSICLNSWRYGWNVWCLSFIFLKLMTKVTFICYITYFWNLYRVV